MSTEKEALNPFDAYQRHVGSKPVLDTALSGAAGTALGYYGSNLALAPLVATIAGATGASPEKVENVKRMIRRYGGLLGGLGGLAYSAGKHMDTSRGIKGALQSMISGDYWKDHPEAMAGRNRKLLDYVTKGRKSIRTPDVIRSLFPEPVRKAVPTQEELELSELRRREMDRLMQQERLERVRSGLQKNQSYQDPFAGEKIPLDYAMTVIQRDPFLSLGKKTVTNGIFESGAEDGAVDGPGIMTGALRFGAGAIPAYLLGKNMSKILTQDPRKVDLLSGLGGVAVGIMNTGIFGD